MRPLDDIHTNCEQDVDKFCGRSYTGILNNPSTYSYGSSPETNIDNDEFIHSTYIPETIADYSETSPDINEEAVENREDQIHSEVARRLTDSDSSTASVSRRTSLSIGVRISPNHSNGPDEGAKDSARFLNYGPKIDTCLWNAFTAKIVSTQCASALSYVNDSINAFPMKYGNEFENMKQTTFSVKIPLASVFLLILCYVLVRELCEEEDDNDDEEDETNDDEVNSEDCEYKIIDVDGL